MPRDRVVLLLVMLFLCIMPNQASAQSERASRRSQTHQLDGVRAGSLDTLPTLLTEQWDTHGEVRWDIAKPLSAIAYQVYEEEPIITRYFLSSLGFELVTEIPFRTMYGYIAVRDDVMVIAFRGTNLTSLSDWQVNWRYKQVLHHGHYFHEGFVEHYLGMQTDIHRSVIRHEPKHIWITGHSLGAL